MATRKALTIKMYDGPLKEKLNRMEGWENMCLVYPGGYAFLNTYLLWHETYQRFDVKKSDVWVVAFPKSGTTWMQEMVWCLLYDNDFEAAKELLLNRFPFFELDSFKGTSKSRLQLADDDPLKPGNTWKIVNSAKEPRTFKSHLPREMLPTGVNTVKPKILYVCRDPRDVCVSYYYHTIMIREYKGDFNDFVDLFLGDMVPYCPYWKNVLSFWESRDEENILFIRYEEMKEDLSKVIKQVGHFLGKEVSEQQIQELCDHLSFASMRKNPAVNKERLKTVSLQKGNDMRFMRKGIVGDWKVHLSEDQKASFQRWTEKHLAGSDFPYYQDYD